MYPRNAASPERIAVGAVVLIADGTVQTSAVTITVRGQGGAEAGSAGTIAFGASGIVYYTPMQAETDFTSFTVIASKASCIPVAVTIITSASATPGHAGLDWGKVINPTTAVGLSGTTVGVVTLVTTLTTYTGNTAQTGDSFARIGVAGAGLTNIDLPNQTFDLVGNITGNLSGSVGSVTGAVGSVTGAVGSVTGAVGSVTAGVTVTTNNDKTGYALSATGSAALTQDYAADGATFTLNQAIYMIWSLLAERSISGTTLTAGKLDGTTAAMTFTLDSATVPNAQTRAT